MTQATCIDIDRVWLDDQSVEAFLEKLNSEFKKDVAKGSVPIIPIPNGVN